jgi:hypothetical protein
MFRQIMTIIGRLPSPKHLRQTMKCGDRHIEENSSNRLYVYNIPCHCGEHKMIILKNWINLLQKLP